MDDVRIEGAGPTFIAKIWGVTTKRQRITLVRDEGWEMFPVDHYVEIEFSHTGEGRGRVHGRIVCIEGAEMIIDGHLAHSPMKVWSNL